MTEENSLIRIDRALLPTAALSGAKAFEDDPYTVALIPDKKKRNCLRYPFEHYLRMSYLSEAQMWTTSRKCEGLAVWMDSLKKEPFLVYLRGGNPFRNLRCGWRYVIGELRANSYAQEIKNKYAPQHHIYLALLAVDPAYQGKGFAGTLLRALIRQAEEQHLACYLETQNEKNVSLYNHFDFKVVFRSVFPMTNTPMFGMLREPQ